MDNSVGALLVSRAMQISEEIQKLVPYKPGKPIEETKREYGLDEVVKLASNENPLGPSPKVIEAMREALAEIHRYPDPSSFALTQAVSKKFDVSTDKIVLGNGSNELIDLLIRLYCVAGDKVVTSQAGFVAYKVCAQVSRVHTEEIPLTDDYVFDFDALSEYVEKNWDSRHKLVFIPNPNNPTGTYVGRQKVEAFLDKFGDRDDMRIVFDEAYSEYVTAEDHPYALDYLGKYSNVIVLRTLSKAYGLAGLRLGILFGDEETASLIHRIRMPFNVNLPAQAGAIAALADEEYLAEGKRVNTEGLEYYYSEFKKMGLNYTPSQGNFLMVDPGIDGAEFFEKLLHKGVIVRPLKPYGFDRIVRVSVGTATENQVAVQAMKEVLGK